MAASVKLIGWKKGLDKVSLSLAIKEHGIDYSLPKAVKDVTSLLNDEIVEVFCKNVRHAQELYTKAVKVGAKARLNSIQIYQEV